MHGWQALKRPIDFVETNWTLKIHGEKCVGCGICIESCPMDAIKLVEKPKIENKRPKKVLSVNSLRCIGCGLCIKKCKKEAIILERVNRWSIPPKTHQEYIEHIHKYRISRFKKYIKAIKAFCGIKVKIPKN